MECDRQGIVFNGAYMDYLEVGQAEYFRNLGFSIYKIAQQGYFDSAVVKAEIDFWKIIGLSGIGLFNSSAWGIKFLPTQ